MDPESLGNICPNHVTRVLVQHMLWGHCGSLLCAFFRRQVEVLQEMVATLRGLCNQISEKLLQATSTLINLEEIAGGKHVKCQPWMESISTHWLSH